ncbi:MAG: hypothetical protein AAF607_01055 [Pseudomonadota bacterium]
MAEEEEVQTAPVPAKQSKLPIIIMLFAGLFLGGGGATAYFLFAAPKPELAETQQSEEEKKKQDLAALKPRFVNVDRISAPLISADNVIVGHVSMYVLLQVDTEDDRDWVRDRLPMVRHAINLGVAKVGVNYKETPFTVDYDATAERIVAAVNDYLHTDRVLAAHIKEAVRL